MPNGYDHQSTFLPRRFRATVWVLTGAAEAALGDEGITRRVCEEEARDADQFKAIIMDRYALTDVDTMVWFGPISEK